MIANDKRRSILSTKFAIAKYDDLAVKYHNLEVNKSKDYETMILTYKNTVLEKDNLMKSPESTIEDCDKKLSTLASEQESKEKEYEDCLRTNVTINESKIKEYDNKLKARDEEFHSRKEMLRLNNTTGKQIHMNDKNVALRLKVKGRGSTKNISNHIL